MRSKKIHCTVYLEGVNVEFNAIQIQEYHGQPPSAIISFPADSAALTLLPKTVAHVFYTDDSGTEVLIFMGELSGSNISFTADKRAIQLTFTGLTKNWYTNVVIPMDLKVRTMVAAGLYAQFSLPDDGQTATAPKTDNIDFLNLGSTSVLDPILARLNGGEETLASILNDLISTFSTNYAGVYWSAVSKAFKFDSMVAIDSLTAYGQDLITKLVQSVGVNQHLQGLANGVPGERPIAEILNTILNAFGFEFCEIAAPSNLVGRRGHIFIKPKTHFFQPIRHNIVIDDNIVQLNFSRSFDEEPTRMIAQTVPFYMQQTDLVSTVLSVIVPANVRTTQAFQNKISSKEEYDNLKMFGLSREEQCRGVVLREHVDNSLIENAYLVAFGKDQNPPIEGQTVNDMVSNTDPDKRRNQSERLAQAARYPQENMSAAEMYHLNLATLDYYDKRHAARSVQVNSPYSPYRMVGFPGVIISKYFPTTTPGIVGNLQSLVSNISSDGDATQSLVFSHCRFVDKDPDTDTRLGFLDDDTTMPVPWFRHYTDLNTIDSFYAQFTGAKDSAVTPKKNKNVTSKNAVSTEIMNIHRELDNPRLDRAAYILTLTTRPLISKTTIDRIYPFNGVRRLYNEAVTEIKGLYPYVSERRERVTKVFKQVLGGN